jgi:hypothetical protein
MFMNVRDIEYNPNPLNTIFDINLNVVDGHGFSRRSTNHFQQVECTRYGGCTNTTLVYCVVAVSWLYPASLRTFLCIDLVYDDGQPGYAHVLFALELHV